MRLGPCLLFAALLAGPFLAGCVAPAPAAGTPCRANAQPGPALEWQPHPALQGDLQSVALRIAAAFGDDVANATPQTALPAAWQGRNGWLLAQPSAEGTVWTYKVRWKWPHDDEGTGLALLQGMLDRLAPQTWTVEAKASTDTHLLVQRFPGSDYTLWAGAWHFEHLEHYKSSTVELRPMRDYAVAPKQVADLVASAQALVSCRMEATGTSWAATLVRPDVESARGLEGVDGRLRLYVPWVWVAGAPPAGCGELGLWGIQVDAATAQVVHAQEPQALARCAPVSAP